MMWTYFFAILTFLELLIIFKLKSKKNKRRRQKTKSYAENNSGRIPSTRELELQNKIKQLEGQLNLKNKEHNDLKKQLSDYRETKTIEKKTSNQEGIKVISEKPSEPIILLDNEIDNNFYLSVPESNQIFYKPDSTSKQKDSSLYKFTIEDDNSGTFQVIEASPQTIKLAFNSPEAYLERACIYKNALDPSKHNNIKTEVPGVFIIDGDKVLINEKTVIEFI